MNPTCEHKLWNDTEIAELARTKSPDLLWPLWDELSMVERADVFRYLVLWDQGGYYSDIDARCQQPIADFPVPKAAWTKDRQVHQKIVVISHFGHKHVGSP